MRAVVARALGAPETFAIEDRAPRAPGPGEVRLAVEAAGVSFVDVLTAAGGYQLKPETPFVPGSEFAGRVLEIGAGVVDLQAGDRICGGGFGAGIFAEQVTLPAANVQRAPEGVDVCELSILRASYLTAWVSLVNRGQLAAGETVLVLGAAGAVGVAACQLARHLGAEVIAAASTEEKRAFALSNGASQVVDSRAADLRDQVKALTGGRGVDVVVDSVGGPATERAFRTLAWRGRHLVVGYASGEIPRLPVNLALLKGASLVGVDVRQFVEYEPQAALAGREEIMRLFGAGAIRPQVGRVFPMESFAEAMNAAAAGDILGRVVLRIA
jgi:NADPH2:quinone reductase